jgi:hypothetical protein
VGVTFAAMMPLALLVQPGTRVVPHESDLMIRTRTSMDRPQSTVTTSTVFLKWSRQRREVLFEFPQSMRNPLAMRVTITQCDTQRAVQLNLEMHLYAIVPVTDPAKDVKRRRHFGQRTRSPTTSSSRVP